MPWQISSSSPSKHKVQFLLRSHIATRIRGVYEIHGTGGEYLSGQFALSASRHLPDRHILNTGFVVETFGITYLQDDQFNQLQVQDDFEDLLPSHLVSKRAIGRRSNGQMYSATIDAYAPYGPFSYPQSYGPTYGDKFDVPYGDGYVPADIEPYFDPYGRGPTYYSEPDPYSTTYGRFDTRGGDDFWEEDPDSGAADRSTVDSEDRLLSSGAEPDWRRVAFRLLSEMPDLPADARKEATEKSDSKGLRTFLNSPFGLWLISTIFIAVFSWGWTQYNDSLRSARETRTEFVHLRTEAMNRITSVRRMMPEQFPARYLDIIRSAIYGVRPGLQSHPTHKLFYAPVYSKYEGRSLRSVVVAHASLAEAQLPETVSAALLTVEDVTEKLPAVDDDTRRSSDETRTETEAALRRIEDWLNSQNVP